MAIARRAAAPRRRAAAVFQASRARPRADGSAAPSAAGLVDAIGLLASSSSISASAISCSRVRGSFRRQRSSRVRIGRWCRGGQRGPIGLVLENADERVRHRLAVKGAAAGQHLVEDARRTPRCRCACPRRGRAPARGSCRPVFRGCARPPCRRTSRTAAGPDHRPDRRPWSCARPKSSTFARASLDGGPDAVVALCSTMFAGFRSRWTMPFSCAASSASAICRAIARASAIGSGPLASRSARVGPSTQFEDQRRHAIDVLEPVDRANVRMIERGQEAGFAREAGTTLGVCCEVRREDLDGDVAPQLAVVRAIDLAHPPAPSGATIVYGPS